MENRAFALGIGGNLGSVRDSIRFCADSLREDLRVSDFRVSSLYRTQPWGSVKGGEFLNAAVCGMWLGTDRELLELCRSIETLRGAPVLKNGDSRTLDVDVLFLAGGVSSPELVLPHPMMAERKFVLVPLCEIWSQPVPGLNETPVDLLKRVDDSSSIIFECNLYSGWQGAEQV